MLPMHFFKMDRPAGGRVNGSCYVSSKFKFSILALALIGASANAQDVIKVGDTVLVTGTRSIEGQDPSLVANTVITRADIERLQPRSLGDLLQASAGITTTRMGGMGKESSMFLRGTESDHVLFLIDGVRVGSATAGKEAFQDIPLDQIDRIEIVRGPFSSLYGSDAIGGVVQIFTRKDATGVRPNFSVAVGSNNYRSLSAGVAGSTERTRFGVNFAHTDTDGINACRGSGTLFKGCYTDEPDRDGYTNNSVSANGTVKWTDRVTSNATALFIKGKNDFDGSYSNHADVEQQVFGLDTRVSFNPRASLLVKVGQSFDDSISSHNGKYVGSVSSRRASAGLQGEFAVADASKLIVGWDGLRDRIGGDTNFASRQRYNRALYSQFSTHFAERHDLQLNARRDDNSQFGGKTTGSIIWGLAFDSRTKLTVSAGTAYKAPSFNELYYPYYGNPNLKPESARNIEVGLTRKSLYGTWSAHAFQNKVDNLIAHDSSLPPYGGPNNIDHALLRGLELQHQARAGDLQLNSQLTFLSPKQDGGMYDGKLLPRRAKNMARIDADYPLSDRFRVGGTFMALSKRYEELANRTALGGYGRLDLRTSYALTPSWRLDASVENVFNRFYESASWYNEPGRNWLLTLRYSQ